MAQIHALLLITGRPFSMDEIIDRLHISRGNASMNLRDLMDWGLIQRIRHQGDRKDLYQCEGDILEMFARVVKERKRREIDPAALAIQDCVDILPDEPASPEAQHTQARLKSLLEMFGLIDLVYAQVFLSEGGHQEAARAIKDGAPFIQNRPARD
jgi:DNA-binding transcriptional regulator GbsR (MarR family)